VHILKKIYKQRGCFPRVFGEGVTFVWTDLNSLLYLQARFPHLMFSSFLYLQSSIRFRNMPLRSESPWQLKPHISLTVALNWKKSKSTHHNDAVQQIL